MTTYAQYVSDIRSDIQSEEGFEHDISVYFDLAESLLFDPAFVKLAKKRFPNVRGKDGLKEAVAHSLY